MVQLTSNVHEMRGRTDVAHIPPMPLWVAIIRILQAIFAIIILALTAFAASVFKVTFAGFGLAWFTFIWTLFFLVYIAVSSIAAPTLYNLWVHLGLEVATTFWWLVTFGVLASEASAWGIVEGYTYVDVYGNIENVDSALPSNWKSAIDCAKASAGLGALEWVLFVITLVMFGLSIHKHRLANGMGTTTAATPGAAVMEEHKMEPMTAQQQPYQQQHTMPVQQPYQQQTMPVQQQNYQQQSMPVQQQHYQQQQMA